MSDRYETPRWDDEPESSASTTAATRSPPRESRPRTWTRRRPTEVDLDASSENVLDGWPATESDPAESDPDEAGRRRRAPL